MKLTKSLLKEQVIKILLEMDDIKPGSPAEKELKKSVQLQFKTSDKGADTLINIRKKMNPALKNTQLDDESLVALAKAQGIDPADMAIQDASSSDFVKTKAEKGNEPTSDSDSRFAHFLKTLSDEK